MAEHPELWTERTPEQRHLFDRQPTFGLARDAERLPQELPPAPEPTVVRKPRRERGPFLTCLWLPWSYGDRGRETSERWHRVQCWCRRHQMVGGHTVQLGSDIVFIERQCRWCGGGAEGAARADG